MLSKEQAYLIANLGSTIWNISCLEKIILLVMINLA